MIYWVLDLVLLHGSPSGVTVSVEILFGRFDTSHSFVLSVHFPISFSKFISVVWVVFFG